MNTATLSLPRTATVGAATTGFDPIAKIVAAVKRLFASREELGEEFLGQAKDHADLAIRQRALAQHEARVRAVMIH